MSPPPRKGRGAVSNRTSRFHSLTRHGFDDGWGGADAEADAPGPRTTVTVDASRTVIAGNRSPDVPFDRSINPYRGCEHGCVYCFARPTHAYLDLSPGLDFETRILAKPDAPKLLARELRKPGYDCRPIAIGTNTDAYQPAERRLGIMRGILEVLAEFRHPVTITTKSALVARDIDILAPMAADGLAAVAVSVTTLTDDLHRKLEPRAPRPARRLETIAALSAAGIPTGVWAAPMIPALNDHELDDILAAGAEAGATLAGYILLRLPLEVKALFEEWLAHHAPDRASRVMAQIRETRDGHANDSRFGARMRGTGTYARLLSQRFALAAKRHGLATRRLALDTTKFRVPPPDTGQLALF